MAGLPYIDVPQRIGPISTFGVLVVVGIAFGTWLARRYARDSGLDQESLSWLGPRLIGWGFAGAFIIDAVVYEWDRLLVEPWSVITAFGISSYGAGVGGAAAFLYYTRRRGLDRRRWADMAAVGAAGGWLFGRIGCAVVHDHLGRTTDFPLGVNVPPGRYPFALEPHVIRAHDLGLYEAALWIALLAALLLLARWKRRRPGFLMGFLAVAYSVPRFLFEFLRLPESDPRYAGLTFAQWASIGALLIGLWLLLTPGRPAPDPSPV